MINHPSASCRFMATNDRIVFMGKLDTAERKALPASDFAGPDRSYPVPDKSHAANAKSRAKQMLNRGTISKAQYDKITAKADRKLDQ